MREFTLFLRAGVVPVLVAACLAICAGCPSAPPDTETVPDRPEPVTLRLLVIGDPQLAKVVKREWDARSEGELKLRELSEEAFAELEQRRLAADAVIYPVGMLGELAAPGWLAPIPRDALYDSAYQQREVFAAVRGLECTWGNEPYAVPLGGPPLLLFYRKDLFDKLSLKPPTTWEEYQALLPELADRQALAEFLPSPDAPWSATVEPLDGLWAAQLLLARSAPYCKHRSQYSALFDYRTMQPLIAGPPFVRAVRELQAVGRSESEMPTNCTPATAVQRLLNGQSAMAIGWLADGDNAAPATSAAKTPEIGVVPLPGSRDVFNFRSQAWEQRDSGESPYVPLVGISGRLGSLTQDCLQPAAALRLLVWLSGPELGAQISSASPATGPFRESHLAQSERWTSGRVDAAVGQRYGQAIQQTLNEPNTLIGLRIPGRQRYLAVLADAIREGLTQPSEEVEALLGKVTTAWQELTESSGVDGQRAAYMQSIGMER